MQYYCVSLSVYLLALELHPEPTLASQPGGLEGEVEHPLHRHHPCARSEHRTNRSLEQA